MYSKIAEIKNRAGDQRSFLNALVAAERVLNNGWDVRSACESTAPYARQGLVESLVEVYGSNEYAEWEASSI
jgi:hypothetical protein